MPKERIYDSFDPSTYGLEAVWDKGGNNVVLGSAVLDDNGDAHTTAPRGTIVPLSLDTAQLDRLISVLQKIRRQLSAERGTR